MTVNSVDVSGQSTPSPTPEGSDSIPGGNIPGAGGGGGGGAPPAFPGFGGNDAVTLQCMGCTYFGVGDGLEAVSIAVSIIYIM